MRIITIDLSQHIAGPESGILLKFSAQIQPLELAKGSGGTSERSDHHHGLGLSTIV